MTCRREWLAPTRTVLVKVIFGVDCLTIRPYGLVCVWRVVKEPVAEAAAGLGCDDFGFFVVSPEINSCGTPVRGSGPLFMAAAAWRVGCGFAGLGVLFDAVIAGLAAAVVGSASVAMAGAAAPYVGWLRAAGGVNRPGGPETP